MPGWLASYGGGAHRPVAFIPDNDTLLLAPDEADVLEQVFEMVEEQYGEAARQISPQGYTIDDFGRVVPLDQLGDHPARAQALRARSGLAVTEYSIQTRFLNEESEAGLESIPGRAPAFAGSVLFQPADSGPVTVTIWGEDVEYLLPQADYVHFARMDSEGEVDVDCTVPFDAVVEILGLVPLPGLNPPRFEARQWPEEAALARLRERAIEL
ncbi:hypothetical protein [Nocardia sp. IFM 10818]